MRVKDQNHFNLGVVNAVICHPLKLYWKHYLLAASISSLVCQSYFILTSFISFNSHNKLLTTKCAFSFKSILLYFLVSSPREWEKLNKKIITKKQKYDSGCVLNPVPVLDHMKKKSVTPCRLLMFRKWSEENIRSQSHLRMKTFTALCTQQILVNIYNWITFRLVR